MSERERESETERESEREREGTHSIVERVGVRGGTHSIVECNHFTRAVTVAY